MKITFLCPRYLWAGGGSVLFTRRLAEEVCARGHTVKILADEPDPGRPSSPADFHGGPVVKLMRNSRREQRAASYLRLMDYRGGYRLGGWLFRSGRTRLTAAGPVCPQLDDPATFAGDDVVVLVNAFSAWTVQLAPVFRNLTGVFKVSIPLFHPHEEGATFPAMAELHQHVDHVCGLTSYERRVFDQAGWPRLDFSSIGAGSDPYPHTVDDSSFRERHGIPLNAPVILFLGRKIYNKGIVQVIEGMERVWRTHPDAWLVLLGFQHNDAAWLQGYIDRSSRGANRVVNIDDVSHHCREEALAGCTLLAVPSVSDSFGIVYLDAWRHRKPVVACRDTCAETFITHHETGLLVPFNNADACGDAMLQLIEQPMLARALGDAGHERWHTSFRWSHVADRFLNVLGVAAS